jgi:hypothetical protein
LYFESTKSMYFKTGFLTAIVGDVSLKSLTIRLLF